MVGVEEVQGGGQSCGGGDGLCWGCTDIYSRGLQAVLGEGVSGRCPDWEKGVLKSRQDLKEWWREAERPGAEKTAAGCKKKRRK